MSDIRTSITLTAKDLASKDIEQITKNVEKLHAAAEKGGRAGGKGGAIKDILGAFNIPTSAGALYTAAATGIAAIGVASIKAASDVEELNSKAKFLFGDAFNEVQVQTQKIAQEVGRAGSQMLGFTADMAAVTEATGLSGKSVQRLSLDFSKLAVDMASFHNKSDIEAFNALRSAITGETEPMKRFGVVMTQANLQAHALSKGIRTQVQDMNQAQQTALRYNYIMEKTKTVQGDAARTSGSVANQFKALWGNTKTLFEELGKPVLPLVSTLLKGMNLVLQDTIGYLQTVAQWAGTAFGALKKYAIMAAQAMGFENVGIKDYSHPDSADRLKASDFKSGEEFMAAESARMAEAAKKQKELDAEFDKMWKDASSLGGGGGVGGGAGKKAGEELKKIGKAMEEVGDTFRKEWKSVNSEIKQLDYQHEQTMTDLEEQIDSATEALAEMGDKYNDLTDDVNKLAEAQQKAFDKYQQNLLGINMDEMDTVVKQVEKIAELQERIARSRAQEGALSTDQLINIMNNRQDKGDALSYADQRAFNLSDEQANQVNLAMQIEKEQKALKGYIDTKVEVDQKLKDALFVGSDNFIKAARDIIAANNDLKSANQRSQRTGFEVDIQKFDTRRTEEEASFADKQAEFNEQSKALEKRRGELDKENETLQNNLNKLNEKKALEQEAYVIQRQEYEKTRSALILFDAVYTDRMNNLNTVTQETVDDMKKKLEELRSTISQIEALMMAKSHITGGNTIQRRLERQAANDAASNTNIQTLNVNMGGVEVNTGEDYGKVRDNITREVQLGILGAPTKK